MKLVDEFRDPALARRYVDAIKEAMTRSWRIMEVCGGQTHSIVRFGIDQMLPEQLTLIHGPGCPVCVTPLEMIDRAIAIAGKPDVILCSFGDMLRVPGSRADLFFAKSQGADVRVVYSPLDALAIARQNPRKQLVFFAVGFETTAPAIAMCAHIGLHEKLDNFSLLISHVLVPPALLTLLADPEARVDAFLAAGHVCTVMGLAEYRPIAEQHRVPIVATGFEPLDLLQGILMCVRQLESGRHEVENQYTRAISERGNLEAQRMLAAVFEVVPRKWRGIGQIPASGLGLRGEYQALDAERRFDVGDTVTEEPAECRSGRVLKGVEKPTDCPAFGTRCTPDHPLGATMVSSEGACAAYFEYRRPA